MIMPGWGVVRILGPNVSKSRPTLCLHINTPHMVPENGCA